MATPIQQPSREDIKKIERALALDRNSNFGRLEYYLKQIIVNRDITFELAGDEVIVIPARKAWEIIVSWSQGEGNLPVGDRDARFNIRSRATRLLDYIQTNIAGKTSEAAANYHHILEQSEKKIVPTNPATTDADKNLERIYNLRHLQTEILQAGLIGKLTTRFDQGEVFKRLPASDRKIVLQMIAAANANFRYVPKEGYQNFAPEKLHQMLLHNPSVGNFNQIMRLAYSKEAQDDFRKISSAIDQTFTEDYGGDEEAFQKDNNLVRSLGRVAPSLSSLTYLINSVQTDATPAEKELIIRNLRTQLLNAAGGEHQSGRDVMAAALRASGMDSSLASYFDNISPYLEEIQVKQRHQLLGSNLSDQDSRLIATSGLAADIGVDLTIPWLKEVDLNSVTERVTSEVAEEFYKENPSEVNGSKSFDLQKAFNYEISKGKDANLERLGEISELMGKHSDFRLYHNTVDGNFWYQVQELWGKGTGNYLAVKQPIDRFTGKVWGGISNIDDVIRWPARSFVKWQENLEEKYPWLNPAKLISEKWVGYQTGIALSIHKWAIKAATSDAWFKSFAGHIADYTEGFVKHEANWGGAGVFFVQRKLGNTLNWATKFATRGKHATFSSLRVSVAKTVWSGFSKMAPGLSAKLAANGLSKIIIGIIGGEMTAGVSIAIQIGWEVLKFGFDTVKKFLTDSKFRERFINRIPLMVGMAVSSSLIFLAGIPAAIVAGVGVAGAAILAFLQAIILSLAPLFGLAAAIALGAVAFIVLFWHILISPTFNLDANTGLAQIFTSIVCDEDKTAEVNKTASCANCLVKYITACYGSGKISGSLMSSKGIGCLIASKLAPNVAQAIQDSAVHEGWLQCIGFARAAALCGGASSFEGRVVAAGYINNAPPGFKYVSGAGSCKPGDLGLIDGDIGHIFVWGNPNGSSVDAIDANYVCDGCVSDKNPIPLSRVAGCLKRN